MILYFQKSGDANKNYINQTAKEEMSELSLICYWNQNVLIEMPGKYYSLYW